ncbi:HAD family hydrolase [Desulfatitalea alkaliphila]|uniref:phosphoglycolate phosphatase n=1 Tax=Desulfatitalea alkaliphila TaxID=2929485 RepID=A0AA41UK17_9BACT|nr:HAD family hydrolase [Desulfatitalea alkaliphila]MCJ8501824.1 HAD family hydrolase [Desulfatitalea alkaliphila]
MTRNTFKVVGFDCDGVMFNSSRANRAYYDHLMERFALPALTDRQFAYAHMHTVDEALNFIVGDPRLLEQVQAYRRQISYRPFIRHMVVEPHLHRLLNSLRPAYKTAIATNRTNTMSHVLEEHGLTELFDKVVTASDVTYAKPHPEQLLLLLAHFAIDPREMVFIGDSELDAAAAHQAGVPFVAFGNPGLHAMAHIEHLGQIPRLLAP